MKKYLSLILVLLFVGLIPIGCIKEGGDCGNGRTNNYFITSFKVSKADNFGRPFEDSTQLRNHNEVNIAIDISGQKFALNKKLDFSFSNQVYACTPPPPRSLNSISAIKISALNDLVYASNTDTIRSGESLNDRFGVKFSFVDKYSSIEEFIMRNFDFLSGQLLLQLKNPPKNPVELKFKLEIEMSDGLKLTYDNLSLRVK